MKKATRVIKPPRLKVGDTIGIIAPSNPITLGEEAVERAYSRLRHLGFAIKEAPQCRFQYGHSAGRVGDRVEAIHAMFGDPNINGVMTFWGGHNSNQLLEYLDYELIRTHPKILIGYSDVTALTVGITARTGLVTFAGPAVITFVKPHIFPETIESFQNILMEPDGSTIYQTSKQCSDTPWYERSDGQMLLEDTPPWQTYQPGKARGPLMGGNIDTMMALLGTDYWPDLDECVLLLEEDENETSGSINRLLTKMRQSGIFEKIVGLAIGRFDCRVGFTQSDSLEMILQETLKGYDFPVLTGVDFGHTDPLLTFPLGIEVELDADSRTITILETAIV